MVDRPNILVLLTDQQSATMMSCAGNPWLATPACDALAARGRRFGRAYVTNPVCTPSRFSLLTGRRPSEIGMRSDDYPRDARLPAEIGEQALGSLFRQAGYRTLYGGKGPLPSLSLPAMGFEVLTNDSRDGLVEAAATVVASDDAQPWLLVAGLANPHDICYLALRDSPVAAEREMLDRAPEAAAALEAALALPPGVDEATFIREHCPPLPPNHKPQADEPEAIGRLLAQRPFRANVRAHWGERKWRLHRWAYARLTEQVDQQIGRLLDALWSGPAADRTVVVLTSDHGDLDGAHRMEHKSAPYEEAARVPLILTSPDLQGPGQVDEAHLIGTGLDLLPTLADYAGIEPPAHLSGRSLRPLLTGTPASPWRSELVLESEIADYVVTARHKYLRYHGGANAEQLHDLVADPGESRNALDDPAYAGVLATLRHALPA